MRTRGESIREAPIDKRTIVRLLHVDDSVELMTYFLKLHDAGFHVGLVREPDPPYHGQAMALATEPITARTGKLSKILFHLKPARFEPEAA